MRCICVQALHLHIRKRCKCVQTLHLHTRNRCICVQTLHLHTISHGISFQALHLRRFFCCKNTKRCICALESSDSLIKRCICALDFSNSLTKRCICVDFSVAKTLNVAFAHFCNATIILNVAFAQKNQWFFNKTLHLRRCARLQSPKVLHLHRFFKG